MLHGKQLRAARALLGWRAADLAERAGVNLSTVQRAEATNRETQLMPANERAIRSTLEAAGIEFIPENGGGVGARLRTPGDD
jgi:transcriptional regulator with XRE-family HTH domain